MKRGFTLIEILLVIAIIGVLATIVLAALGGSRAKGRDATRVSEVRQVQYALELYYGIHSSYPTALSALQTGGFMSPIPTDPSNSATAYSYAATGSGASCTGYHLGVILEDYTNMILTNDADQLSTVGVCTGSPANFDGTSAGTGAGTACNATGATKQPGGGSSGERCFDVTN